MKWHSGKTIWFTGLSGSGKSTLSSMLKTILESREVPVVLLDGDLLREGLNRDLGFSGLDRAENIRRSAEVAKILSDAGHTVVAAFITPYESLRAAVRGVFEPTRFVEVFLDCPLSVCETRDPKGLYCRARAGEISEFTGISAPFERPSEPELVIPTGGQRIEESLAMLLGFLETRFPDLRCDAPANACGHVRIRGRKMAVIGLDCVPPELVFGAAGRNVRNIRSLMRHGCWGPLRSVDPPITIPAWTTLTTGKDPGELGLYGFRNRRDYGYGEMFTANSRHVTERRVWEYLEDAGKATALLGVPQTYPPDPHRGLTVAGFLTPGANAAFTYPEELADRIHTIADGEYLMDVEDFRTEDKDRLLSDLYTMVDRRFRVAADLLTRDQPDFLMMVEIGTDRLHHAFWKYHSPDHPEYEPGNPYETAIVDFYRFIDSWIGSLLAAMSDETTVMVVSDHGVKTLRGSVRVNQWLIREGLLTLNREPDEPRRLTHDMIDWSQTTAWSDGGYYARIFINLKGREPQGTVEPDRYEAFRDDLALKLKEIRSESGEPMNTHTLRPEEIYRRRENVPPDLIVYFDDLHRRAAGGVGYDSILCSADDMGPDYANHDHEGIFIASRISDFRSGAVKDRKIENASLMDVTPTILHEFGLSTPSDMSGAIINLDGPDFTKVAGSRASKGNPPKETEETAAEDDFTSEEEEIIRRRLSDLGYM